MSKEFLGRGWSFPPTFDAGVAGVEMMEYEDDVKSSLHILLTTMRGERIMLPTYGCGLEELLFESLDTRTKTLVKDKIEAAILYHEPRIKVERVDLNDEGQLEGVILIEITYRVKSTNSRFNFVHPFYKEEGTDVNLTTSIRLLSEV